MVGERTVSVRDRQLAASLPARRADLESRPLIGTEPEGRSKDPVAENTDTYAFVSPDDPGTVTLISNYVPLEAPFGGPNFLEFGDDALPAYAPPRTESFFGASRAIASPRLSICPATRTGLRHRTIALRHRPIPLVQSDSPASAVLVIPMRGKQRRRSRDSRRLRHHRL